MYMFQCTYAWICIPSVAHTQYMHGYVYYVNQSLYLSFHVGRGCRHDVYHISTVERLP